MKKSKLYYGTIYLYHKGKNYGVKRTQIGAKGIQDARKKLKKKYAYKSDGVWNTVIVKDIISREDAKAKGDVF